MKKNWLLLLTVILTGFYLSAQDSPNSYWVKLKDKNGTPYQVDQPEAFLSQRAIDRRIKQHIAIDETDLPVTPFYLDSLRKLGLQVVHSSKWLNGTTVRTVDTTLIHKIKALYFVESVELTRPGNALKSSHLKFKEAEEKTELLPGHYGKAFNQLKQLNGQYLHNRGFRGKGIHIAVLDAGFWHVDELVAFDSLRSSGRILGTHDFVDPLSDVYKQHMHGMMVLSTMGGNMPGMLVGTSPDASFYLFRSEDDVSEYLIEEDNWVAAAELADSVGVDLINSSLGYYMFDDPAMDHPWSDMNGLKNRVTQGANMAFQKGILVFSSAGNEANNPWRHIISPADGQNVIAVAAVDTLGNRASFSSLGPAYGGAVKPNVAALGRLTYLVNSQGEPGHSNGTSFSSPVLAGMGACLMQAHPLATVRQLKTAIEQSSSNFSSPDSMLGYGIPNFEKADMILKNMRLAETETGLFSIWPNPFTNQISVKNFHSNTKEKTQIRIYNSQGLSLGQLEYATQEVIMIDKLENLPLGLLILEIWCGDNREKFKLIKTTR